MTLPSTSLSFWQDESFSATHETDIAVVGAGICGVATAWHLSQKGFRVTLLDRRKVGAGATGRNAGFLLPGLAEHPIRMAGLLGSDRAAEIYRYTLKNIHQVGEALGPQKPNWWEPVGALLLPRDEVEANELRESHDWLKSQNFKSEILDRPTVRKRVDSPLFSMGLLLPEGVGVHPVALLRHLLQNCQSQMLCLENAKVTHWSEEEAGVVLHTSRGSVRAMRAIFCLNAESSTLLPFLHDRILPNRGQMFRTVPLDVQLMTGLAYADHGYEYFRQLPDRTLLMGGWRQHAMSTEETTDEIPTQRIQSGLESFLHRIFPQIKNTPEITHRWAGIMGFSCDGLPVLGFVPGTNRVAYAGGFTGHGMGLAFALAEEASAMLSEGTPSKLFDGRRMDI